MIGIFDIHGSRHIVMCLAVICTVLAGCEPTARPRQRPRNQTRERNSQDTLLKGMDYLNRLDQFEYNVGLTQAEYQFDRWLEKQEQDPDWEPDPMSKRGSRDIRESGLLENLDAWTFELSDVQAIHEAIWMRDISNHVVQRLTPNARLKQWLTEQGDRFSEVSQEELLIAERLFDWTIRNIQLEATMPYPVQAVAPRADSSNQKRILPARQAIPGPGYRFPPWEILQYGYGDALQRSRVFIELGRQQGIDVVYLAFPGKSVPPRARPWITAVAIEEELFLFDCELGLPLPTKDGLGIMTLAEVIDDPSLLDALSSSERDYRPDPEDMKEILALVNVAPVSLSQRMKLVEDNLAGEQRTILTVAPSRIADRMKNMKGISATTLWAAPFETILFQSAMFEVLRTNENFARTYYELVGIFKKHTALVQGRHLHLRGLFEPEGEESNGAKEYYMKSRTPEVIIEQLDDARRAERDLGLVRAPRENDFEWQQRLNNAKADSIKAKQHSSYWLGLVHYDSGNYESAASWFEQRCLALYPEGPWTGGARYNLARCHEALGDYQKARELYLEDDSPQQHGNLIRAKLIAQWTSIDESANTE